MTDNGKATSCVIDSNEKEKYKVEGANRPLPAVGVLIKQRYV